MSVEVDRSAVGARFSDDPTAVLEMLDVLACLENCQDILLIV
jgi:hypothetical protein